MWSFAKPKFGWGKPGRGGNQTPIIELSELSAKTKGVNMITYFKWNMKGANEGWLYCSTTGLLPLSQTSVEWSQHISVLTFQHSQHNFLYFIFREAPIKNGEPIFYKSLFLWHILPLFLPKIFGKGSHRS